MRNRCMVIRIPDIIQLNDWEPGKFLRMMAAVQLAMLGAIGLDFIGLKIPILRQVVGFVYLTFVPGIVILRILRLHRLGITETLLFSTGLSISFLMFSGFSLNTILSFLKVNFPLSFWNVIIFINALLALLCVLSYKTNRIYQHEPPPLKVSRQALYIALLPVLSIVGTYLVNFHKNNIVLLVLIVLIAVIPILAAFNRFPSELYPLAIVVIAISLLFHRSLISMYLTGWDIHTEYYFHKLVVNNAYWDSNIESNVNAMLSIVILPAVYSYFLKMDGVWVFKIVYPVIFSLVPLGLYRVYLNQIKNDRTAFFSVFFFMSFFTFFTEMLSLARQEIAELFFVLLILLVVQDKLIKYKRNILLLVFGASLATSHYGLSYIYMLMIVFIFLFSAGIIRASKINTLTLPRFSLKKSTFNYFVLFYIVFTVLWYINVSSSSAFKTIVHVGDQIYTSIFTEFLKPESRDTSTLLALGIKEPLVHSIGREIHRDLQLITQFFIVIGFFKIIIYKNFTKLKAEYFYLIAANFVILVLSILPYFAKSFNMTRLYHIALFALSPLFIIGGIFVIENIIKTARIKNKLKQNHVVIILILGVLIPYFFFNTGFVYEMTKDVPTSMSLGMERMKEYNVSRNSLYGAYTPEQSVFSAKWISEHRNRDIIIYSGAISSLHILLAYGLINNSFTLMNDTKLYKKNNYMYLSSFNIDTGLFMGFDRNIYNISEMKYIPENKDIIYSNNGSTIYYISK